MKIDIIGDIHGCYQEFRELTTKLGYMWESGLPIHPNGRQLAFVGDLTDRGPHSLKIIRIVYQLVLEKKIAFYAPGNHCDKLYRFFQGNKVQHKHGLETTVAEYEGCSPAEKKKIKHMFTELYEKAPLYVELFDQKLIIAHAGIRERYIGRYDKKVRTFVLYGDITGETDEKGMPIRRDWAKDYSGDSFVVYGHTPVKTPRQMNNTTNIDTGAVFGGALTAFQYPEMTTVSVPSTMPYVEEKFRSFD
ncbi:bis(5'-nucleosyl)-tetraphosphatase PrpE [Priestia koreensis]|uniref:bis(5'-nucleosyl)-tetraphosphatase PrpE n=1 Tax=Priestia koreensis TaxID=284581 RepID=UPI00345818E9